MPGPTAATLEHVNAFPIGGTILFKHYFDGATVFSRLKPYYNGTHYRFEVPAGEFDSLRRFLHSRGYEISVVDQLVDYYVVVPQYSDHPDGIFKASVRHESANGYNCFLMKDRGAVDRVVAAGAAPMASQPLDCATESLGSFVESVP